MVMESRGYLSASFFIVLFLILIVYIAIGTVDGGAFKAASNVGAYVILRKKT